MAYMSECCYASITFNTDKCGWLNREDETDTLTVSSLKYTKQQTIGKMMAKCREYSIYENFLLYSNLVLHQATDLSPLGHGKGPIFNNYPH